MLFFFHFQLQRASFLKFFSGLGVLNTFFFLLYLVDVFAILLIRQKHRSKTIQGKQIFRFFFLQMWLSNAIFLSRKWKRQRIRSNLWKPPYATYLWYGGERRLWNVVLKRKKIKILVWKWTFVVIYNIVSCFWYLLNLTPFCNTTNDNEWERKVGVSSHIFIIHVRSMNQSLLFHRQVFWEKVSSVEDTPRRLTE